MKILVACEYSGRVREAFQAGASLMLETLKSTPPPKKKK